MVINGYLTWRGYGLLGLGEESIFYGRRKGGLIKFGGLASRAFGNNVM